MSDLDWTAWQLADSAFPTGGFAHSGGIEAAIQGGAIRDERSIITTVEAVVHQTAFGALPAVSAVLREPARFDEVEDRLDAVLTNHVARRASVTQGQAMLSAAPRIFRDAALRGWAADCRGSGTPGHLAPVFGYTAWSLGFDADSAAELYLFMSLRSALSAAVRLGAVGPIAAQALIRELIPSARQAARQASVLDLDDLYQALPLLELLQSGQDRLYSRLFQS
ncbi:MAG: urease accessory UreF family protein [Planctomycetota bacterium]